jgi:hypothetical protein
MICGRHDAVHRNVIHTSKNALWLIQYAIAYIMNSVSKGFRKEIYYLSEAQVEGCLP